MIETTTSHIEVTVLREGVERRYEADHAGDTVDLDGELLPATVLATRLAAIVGLTPRPQQPAAELVLVDQQLLEQHLASGTSTTATETREHLALPAEAPDELALALAALPGAATGRWRVETGGAPALEAIDGGVTGWWQLLAGQDSLVAVATSSSRLLWAQLSALTASPEPRSGAATL